jgi:ribosomal protein L28
MLCDWIGAGKAQGKVSPKDDYLYETRRWWKANNHKMQLHPNTREYFIKLLENEN